MTNYFQAIGWIEAEIIEKTVITEGKKNKQLQLKFQGKTYDCKFLTKSRGGTIPCVKTVNKWISNKGKTILGVYPRWIHFPDRNTPYKFYFEIFSWGEAPKDKILNKFYLSGIWQFIAVYQRPVVSIYRNKKRNDLDTLKTNHCPIFWPNAPVRPYKFSPKQTKNKTNKYFINSICKFDHRYQSLIIDYLIDEPSLIIPSYKKPQKSTIKNFKKTTKSLPKATINT